MLNHCRALDLTNDKGFLCGKVLADLGADVIKIERPGGDSSRKIGGFWGDVPDPEKSLYWFAYNSNKRGITLNIESAEGREIFKKLVKTADFVIESFPPDYMDKLGLGYSSLSEINRGIIMASITPFGREGPYRDYKDSDIVVMGMSGTLYQTGESDGPPVYISMPQACLHAGADAAVGVMIAYHYREMTGEGQHVDVSMQQSAAWFQANAIPTWELNRKNLKRAGAFRAGMSKDVGQRQVWPCRDGYVFFNVIGGRTGAKSLSALVEWMEADGGATDFLRNMEWDNFDMFTVTREEMGRISGPVGEFFLRHTRKELLAGAVPRGVSIGPLSSMQDLLTDECLNARNFWVEIEHPELGTSITYPRDFVKSSEVDCSTRFRAPLIGEHNAEVYNEIGLSKRELITLEQSGII
ncbi:MAG: CoA transferase [Dehalococcoidales bacterium]|nr:CoA transferase [Dehalococcoidales bacterium]